ncbi:MAG TPA: hypothetical protein VN300_07415, partial [Desulfobacterales bacterium]|nr:hypothetical protein [Desulfobacterales bacterium]
MGNALKEVVAAVGPAEFHGLQAAGGHRVALARKRGPAEDGFGALNRLLARYLERTYGYWLSESDPVAACSREAAEFGGADSCDDLFQGISHRRIQ